MVICLFLNNHTSWLGRWTKIGKTRSQRICKESLAIFQTIYHCSLAMTHRLSELKGIWKAMYSAMPFYRGGNQAPEKLLMVPNFYPCFKGSLSLSPPVFFLSPPSLLFFLLIFIFLFLLISHEALFASHSETDPSSELPQSLESHWMPLEKIFHSVTLMGQHSYKKTVGSFIMKHQATFPAYCVFAHKDSPSKHLQDNA